MSKGSIPTWIIAALVVLILLTYAGTYQVAFNQVAVKVRLGKADEGSVINRDGDEEGLKLRWPWPIETIQTYDTRLRTMDTSETEIKTVDGKNVIIGTYAVWKIAEPLQFYKRVRTVPEAEKHMRARISQIQAAVVGQRTMSHFVNLDTELKDRRYDELLEDMRTGVAPELLADYGIELREIGIRRISLPQEVTQKVFQSMIQDRRTLAERYRQEGKSRAEAIEARAQADADQILAFAGTKAQETRSAGIQAATRIFQQIAAADAEFFEFLLYMDALKATLQQRTTIFIDKSSQLFEPFVNPPVPADSRP